MSKPTTRERILDVAEAHFAQRGFGATSLGDVAGEVGIRPPSLYKHFGGKQKLYEAVLERLLAPYFETLYELLDTPQQAADAERNLLAVLQHYVGSPNLGRLVQHAALAGGDELDLLVERWYGPFLTRAAELTADTPAVRDRSPEDVGLLVMTFHAFMSGYVTLAPLHEATLGIDPLSDEALTRLRAMLQQAIAALWS